MLAPNPRGKAYAEGQADISGSEDGSHCRYIFLQDSTNLHHGSIYYWSFAAVFHFHFRQKSRILL